MGFTIEIPAAPALVIEQLNKSGFQAYAVGGCVRDSLLGLKPNDWDVCTSAQPDEILACFTNQRTIPTGYQHGTVTVMIDDLPIEVTTYRIDGSYTDGRHPDGVVFTPCLEEDLARRDFTVNAMAYHPREGLVDCYNGCEDLKNKVLRCVGDPKKRFTEDALRILRAYRFASQLGLTIEKNTEMAAEELIANVSLVATERVYQEISKLICGPWAGRVLATYPTILKHVLPFWQSVPMDILNKIDRLSKEVSFRFGI
ncbi:MAG: CCA tRNA nucleotidyltransferase [Clostridia bacterium]|nr:CCA tRNA nucleotidyltransferase [Clostridia bacterium]